MDGLTYTIRTQTKPTEVARQTLWDEPVLAILDAMGDLYNWTDLGKVGSSSYYKLDATKLADAVYASLKANTSSVLNNACVF
jgi:hypothetical protein